MNWNVEPVALAQHRPAADRVFTSRERPSASVEPRLLHGLFFRMENGAPRRLMTGWGDVAEIGNRFTMGSAGETMMKVLRLSVVMVGGAIGLFFGTVMPGQAEPQTMNGDAARGKVLFERNCAGCHGSQGGGDGYRLLGPNPADLTAPSTRKKSDAELLKTIHEGKPNMPAWKVNLTERQIRDVLAYVRTLPK